LLNKCLKYDVALPTWGKKRKIDILLVDENSSYLHDALTKGLINTIHKLNQIRVIKKSVL